MVAARALRRFYGSAAWRDLKGAALYLKGRRCAMCGRTDRPFHVDHIVPVRVAWAARLSMTNLQVLCVPCHGGKKRRIENAKWRRRK
ncbi:MAG: HNH endonuclease [Rhizobiaceae bacterium]|nr:HNH endonuclease [Rhizobiaceae bacterium]